MTVPESLIKLFEPWNDLYSHSKLTATVVIFLHVGGLLLGGGLAIAADRSTLRALRNAAGERTHQLRELAAVHRLVIVGLVTVMVSGFALFTADIEAFFGSWIFWVKMVLVLLLLINGLMMTRTEASIERDASSGKTDTSSHWQALHRTAVTSLTLWFATAAFGVALANFA